MKKLILTSFIALCVICSGTAQPFWQLTGEFPGGPKTAIAGIGDTCLFVGLTNGVSKSTNEGDQWSMVLQSSVIYSLYAAGNGMVLAGGSGKIFISRDFGMHWDSLDLGHNFVVNKFAGNPDGGLFAITGNLDLDLGYVGAGVYYSGDKGESWVQRNNGLNNFLSCDQLTTDRNGRVYVTVRDELSDGLGGLYVSENDGLQWTHIDITIDGQGVIINDVDVSNTWGLSISREDTLYISLEGSAGTVGVRLNLHKSLADLPVNTFWQQTVLQEGPSWWFDQPLNSIHFARNGDSYSSLSGSVNVGGTFFRKKGSLRWERRLEGLGLDLFGFFGVQSFTETPSGKIFMVQFLDERIYLADTSLISDVNDFFFQDKDAFLVYPNPVKANTPYFFFFEGEEQPLEVFLLDIHGRILSHVPEWTRDMPLIAPEKPGMYFLKFRGRVIRLICI